MPQDAKDRLEDAWAALWREGGPYNLPQTLQHGVTHGATHLKSINRVSLKDTGPLTLFKKQPWGGVSLDLAHNLLTGFDSATDGGFEYDENTGECVARLALPAMRYSGRYAVRKGAMRPTALEAAGEAMVVGDSAAPTDQQDQNLTAARSHESTLLTTSPNGLTLVGAYWDNNESYQEVWGLSPSLTNYWKAYPTNGQVTKDFATHTYSATLPGASIPVNGVVSSNGYSDYNHHSFLMSNLVSAACFAVASKCQSSNPDRAARFMTAGNAVSSFTGVSTRFAYSKSYSASEVMGLVGSDSATETVVGASPYGEKRPEWMQHAQQKVDELSADIAKDIEACGGELTPIFASRRAPFQGDFEDRFAITGLTLKGRVEKDEQGGATVTFTHVEAELPGIRIALEPFEGAMFPEVEKAVDDSDFLKDALAQRLQAALAKSRIGSLVGSLLTHAAAESFGPTHTHLIGG